MMPNACDGDSKRAVGEEFDLRRWRDLEMVICRTKWVEATQEPPSWQINTRYGGVKLQKAPNSCKPSLETRLVWTPAAGPTPQEHPPAKIRITGLQARQGVSVELHLCVYGKSMTFGIIYMYLVLFTTGFVSSLLLSQFHPAKSYGYAAQVLAISKNQAVEASWKVCGCFLPCRPLGCFQTLLGNFEPAGWFAPHRQALANCSSLGIRCNLDSQ